MAIILETSYTKKLGLPGYSSHAFALTVKTELTDPAQVAAESRRLYTLLQSCVDRELQQTGYLPQNGMAKAPVNGNGTPPLPGAEPGLRLDSWGCSPRQRELLLRIISEHSLDKAAVESLAQDRFDKSVRTLNRLETSALLDELIAQTNHFGNNPRPGKGADTGAVAR